MGQHPTGLLLVHGGATSARHWDLVVPRLTVPALAADVPGRGSRPADLATLTLDAACDSVAADAGTLEVGRLVVVVHSSGGLLVPGLVERLDVAHVVFIAASVTADGGCGLDAMKPAHAQGVHALRASAAAAGTVALSPAEPPSRERMRCSWGETMSDEQLDFVSHPSRWIADTVAFYDDTLDWSRVRPLPSTYVMTVRDRAVPVALQRQMVAHLPDAAVVPLDCGHLPAVTMPDVVAALLNGIAAATSEGVAL